MKLKVLGTSHEGYHASKEELDLAGGHSAGICYMPQDIDSLYNEPVEKTAKRANGTKIMAHHSVFGHSYINLALEDIPKGLAIVLNNEMAFNTSERSARYKKMVLNMGEEVLYNKWLNKFKELIKNKYKDKFPEFFSDSKIEKLAQENARYLTSVFTPTTMEYSVSYQQLNYIYGMMQREIDNPDSNAFMKALKQPMKDFCALLEETGYIDKNIVRGVLIKNRKLSVVACRKPEQYFGDVYSVSYKGSFAQYAQAQRHRTIKYNFSLPSKNEYYVPPILKNNSKLVEEWLKDCESQASNFPQGMLIDINEMGTLDWFIQKMKERKCSEAQLEINQQTSQLLEQYVEELYNKGYDRAEELKQYTKGARCTFPDFKCPKACKFKDGITEEREI